MSNVAIQVMSQLKDFQRATVDHVFDRLYVADDRVRRFLVADEVGLGKTLVARGVIARAVDHLSSTTDRIDVVYVCSNQAIAQQNLNRIQLSEEGSYAKADRLTLLPINMKDMSKQKINFVSFTPGTSFDAHSSMGITKERALLWWMLRDAWGARRMNRPGVGRAMRGGAKLSSFEWWCWRVEGEGYDKGISRSYTKALAERPDLLDLFMSVTRRTAKPEKQWSKQLRAERRQLIGELRGLLAVTCVDALEPDLVVLDEFQRFRHLLSDDHELTRPLFNFHDRKTGEPVRLLLLSATPYKMFTSGHDDENHYEDFIETIKFLREDDQIPLGALMEAFRSQILAPVHDDRAVESAKRAIETELRKVMVRTERSAGGADKNAMLRDVPATTRLAAADLHEYVANETLAELLDAPDGMEYWKSVPYFLNFMDEYAVSRRLVEKAQHRSTWAGIQPNISDRYRLTEQGIKDYGSVVFNNPRFRWLHEKYVASESWKQLWLTPSLPYYRVTGPFANGGPTTKMLVFSAWKAVPKSVAGLLSYDVERRLAELWSEALEHGSLGRQIAAPLTFRRDANGEPGSMTTMALVYPSPILAQLGDVRRLNLGPNADLAEIRGLVAAEIADLIEPLVAHASNEGRDDISWYWATAAFMEPEAVGWLRSQRNAFGRDDSQDQATTFSGHANKYEIVAAEGPEGLGRPPSDLAERLADIALFAPASIALRSLAGISGAADFGNHDLRSAAFRVAASLRNLFNSPEGRLVTEATVSSGPYWTRVLEYAALGCLQAAIDEHAHVLVESEGLADKNSEQRWDGVASAIEKALGTRSGRSVAHDPLRLDEGLRNAQIHLSTHFAERFTKDKTSDDSSHRSEDVRNAFNSPFWPFILTTTSIGQEGLDFHQFCHAITHWNLPSNPVDFEQREGRIHRFKGHAVRKNVAAIYGTVGRNSAGDPWTMMFNEAAADRPGDLNELTPFWVYPIPGGAHIERHVPVMPLSKDAERYERLRTDVTLYRLAFGQPRQDDLLEFFRKRGDTSDEVRRAFYRIDLSPPTNGLAPPRSVLSTVREVGSSE